MHPILFRIPLPGWTLPLGPVFGLAFVLSALAAGIGWYRRSKRIALAGGLGALATVIAAVALRDAHFRLGPIPVPSYGLMLFLGLVAGWHLTLRLADRDGLPRGLVEACYVVAALSGLAGARLVFAAIHAAELGSLWDVLALRSGGLSLYGGLLGGVAGSWWLARRRPISFFAWADVAAPSVVAGIALGRLGCYLFGCDFGEPLAQGAPEWLRRIGTFPRWPEGTLPLSSGSPAWVEHVTSRGLSYAATSSLPVHPTQLYESLAGVLLLGAAFALRARARFRGQVFLTLALGYGALRFLLETVRGDAERGLLGPELGVRWLVSGGLAVMGAAVALGPARSLPSLRARRIAQALACLPALLAFFALSRSEARVSLSQWLAVITVLAAAIAWRKIEGRVAASPASSAA